MMLTRRGFASVVAAAVGLSVGVPGAARAAELVVGEQTGIPQQVTVERGKSAPFELQVAATGTVTCATHRDSGVGATVNTSFDVSSGGAVTQAKPSGQLPFYATGAGVLNCPVGWDNSPQPYKLIATVHADPSAPLGVHQVTTSAAVVNPGLSFLGPLRDDTPATVNVNVISPLPPPSENHSVNLLPVSGQVYVRTPGGPVTRIDGPIHIPIRSTVDARSGHVDLVSDKDGHENSQSAEFWLGRFKVGYTRKTVDGTGTTARPTTELNVLSNLPKTCGTARGKKSDAHSSRKRKRRRLWGRGKGHFRTRGRHGAATVRGTTWYTEDSCLGTLVRVRKGVVSVRDFGLDQTVRVRAGHSYLAAPKGAADASG